jgi:hypothetical protein
MNDKNVDFSSALRNDGNCCENMKMEYAYLYCSSVA